MVDTIPDDQERSEKIAAMQRYVDEGLASGTGSKTREALFEEACARRDARTRDQR